MPHAFSDETLVPEAALAPLMTRAQAMSVRTGDDAFIGDAALVCGDALERELHLHASFRPITLSTRRRRMSAR